MGIWFCTLAGAEAGLATAILRAVGFNPFRPHRTRSGDYVMVGAALVVCVVLVLWALL